VTHFGVLAASVVLATALLVGALRIVQARRPSPIPVVVLVGNQQVQGSLRRPLSRGVRRLSQLLGGDLPADLIVVQEVLDGGTVRGCCCTLPRPDGSCATVIRLALRVDQRRLTTDELLAALADQCLVMLTGASRPEALRLLPASPPNLNGLEALFPGKDSDRHRNPPRA